MYQQMYLQDDAIRHVGEASTMSVAVICSNRRNVLMLIAVGRAGRYFRQLKRH